MQQKPSDMNSQSLAYSRYKSRHTVKVVTCAAPNGALVQTTSDSAVVDHCKLFDQLEPGDMLLADKGFNTFDKLPVGVSLNIPPFLSTKCHFTEEAGHCNNVGRSRNHVERANERIKNFDILNNFPAQYRHLFTKLFQLCCCLINLHIC